MSNLLVTRDYTRKDASAAASDLGCFAAPFLLLGWERKLAGDKW